MRSRPLAWFFLSVLLFAGAVCVWQLADRWQVRKTQPPPTVGERERAPQATPPQAGGQSRPFRLLSSPAEASASVAGVRKVTALAHRLSNTAQTPAQLVRSDHAVLLENALIDTASGAPLPVPEHLRAVGDPGTYIVQARGKIGDNFRAALRDAGASVVAYVPNNAYLVRVEAAGAQRLAALPQTQTVLPYEPYYKLKPDLLRLAVKRAPLAEGDRLNVAIFEDTREATVEAFGQMGADILAEERSPFGPVLTIRPDVHGLIALAQLPGVQLIEPHAERVAANDLSRVRLRVAPDTTGTTNNYLGLTGNGVLVNVNDTGVDAGHPDLAGRMIGDPADPLSLFDTNGHGTHVAGIIAGNGARSSTVSNASGSVAGADFRGKAPAARIFSQRVNMPNRPSLVAGSPAVSDAYLQENAARTNALISNNSWVYAGSSVYDLHAANYDAAVRDALPAVPGSQPLLCVFAAGNAGNGEDNGLDGESGSIRSPGTAKNVITVGALEQLRNITNAWSLVDTNTTPPTTNNVAPFETMTDSDDEVAGLSSRGSVGIGIEGEFGRFKPDVVAPGVFVVSTRSTDWNTSEYYYVNPTNYTVRPFTNLFVETGQSFSNSIFLPNDTVGLVIEVTPNEDSPVPFPGLPISVQAGGWPAPGSPLGTNRVSLPPAAALSPVDMEWFYTVGNVTGQPISFDLTTTRIWVNTDPDATNWLQVLRDLNDGLGPYYRYESGTSMSAAQASGVLALMQEFFATKLSRTNSPALMKALLINGARPVNAIRYDLQVGSLINYQGWGLINLTNSLPSLAVSNLIAFDQDPAKALVTGQSQTRRIQVNPTDRARTLRMTLAWTDPPGNPLVGVKLVNDLDLIVTNLDTGQVYFGNDIPSGSDFTRAWWPTNAPVISDILNNVENVYLPPLLDTNYSITVRANRVNVNAVTAHPDNVVQDYALVISLGDGPVGGSINPAADPLLSPNVARVRFVTNAAAGGFLLNDRVGANAPLLGLTNGMTNQWNFYVFTNTTADVTNLVFFTFQARDLSIPRMGVREGAVENATRVEADIDLYVTSNPQLTNLDAGVVGQCAANNRPSYASSRSRGGTELIYLTNPPPGQPYYIGIKSEDQMAAEYVFGVLTNASTSPCNPQSAGPALIPDGTADDPGVVNLIYVFVPDPGCPFERIRRVIVTNTMTHEWFGDLQGELSFNTKFAFLNNHTFPDGQMNGTFTYIYEDNGEGDIPGARPTDGPGSLVNFLGDSPYGLWVLTMADNLRPNTGTVDRATLKLEPEVANGGVFEVPARKLLYIGSIDVPGGATNLTISITNITVPTNNQGNVELLVRFGRRPTLADADYRLTINPPSGALSIRDTDLPPLREGRYYVSIYNPNPLPQTLSWTWTIAVDPSRLSPFIFTSTNRVPLLDDAVIYDTIAVPLDRKIAQVEVGLRVDHPRVSDLVFHLISPSGTRVLLMENRGNTNDAGIGSTLTITNVIPVSTNGGPATSTNFLDTGATSGMLTIDYDFFPIPDQMTVYYEGVRLYDSGMISGPGQFTVNYGPGASTQVMIIMNEFGNMNLSTRWQYTVTAVQTIHNYLVFTENTNFTATPIKFLPPPFASTSVSTNFLLSGFEVAAGDYIAPAVVDGWTVASNQVSVIADAALAHSGTGLLALADGQIRRTLPTVLGRSYALQFAYRGPGIVSWWRGEGNATDSVSANNGFPVNNVLFAPGVVGRAFSLDGLGSYIRVPHNPSLSFTNALTLELWYLDLDSRFQGDHYGLIAKRGTSVGPCNFGINHRYSDQAVQAYYRDPTVGGPVYQVSLYRPKPPMYVFHHHAASFKQVGANSVELKTYIDGQLVRTDVLAGRLVNTVNTEPVTIGASSASGELLNGFIDEPSIYGRALSASEIRAIHNAAGGGKFDPAAPAPQNLAKAQVSVGGSSPEIFFGDNTNWQTRATAFTATQNGTPAQLDGLEPGMLLDTFRLTEQAGALYVLPEETLGALTGEDTLGAWRLEVLDNRAGASNPVPALVSWQLRFRFQDVVPTPKILIHGQPSTTTIPAGLIAYYAVDVPGWARYATNLLLSATAPVNVWFNQINPPTGTNAADTLLIGPATSGSYTLRTGGTPPLLPGQRYYLGVQNTNAIAVTATLQVDFDITPLTNAVPVTSTLAAGATPRYFYHDVSTNALAVSYKLHNLSGDVNLVARRGPPLPTLSSYDYGSFNPGTNDEEILIFTNSTPVALSPGRWYLGVFNADLVPVTYTILVTEYTNLVPAIITLINGVPYYNTNAGPAGTLDYYRYVVTSNAARAQFEINGPGADLTLVARKGFPPLPNLVTNDYLSANANTNDELILIFTNSAPVPLSAGDWFLSAVNISGAATSYAIKATEWPVTGRPIVITNVTVITNSFCLTWTSLPDAHYYVQGVTDLTSTNWVTLSPTITAADYFTTWCVALPSPFHFFRVVEGLALNVYIPAPIVRSITRQPAGILLEWSGPTNLQYRVDWTPTVAPPAWNSFTNTFTSTTGLFSFLDDGSQTGGLGAARYYRLVQLP